MHRCAFCGLGLPRRDHFFSGLAGAAICDCCTELAVELAKSPAPLAEVVIRGGSEDVSCRFCGRGRWDCEPGGLVGRLPETFICSDCERVAAAELGVT
jgi:ClpX C4-type zinc finger